MNQLFLMKNPDLFQGEKYLNSNRNYFEGWYFKHTNIEKGISFIPGISIDKNSKEAFVQIITNDSSYFVNYPIKDFTFHFNPFWIKIGKNVFSKEDIHIEIEDTLQNLSINGDIEYFDIKTIHTNLLAPNIMGPFSYIPFMECNHALLSMEHKTRGSIHINNQKLDFNNGKGYIEKDWGCSFPKSYLWCQGNNFKKTNASFMLSIANIPFKLFEFQGIICDLMIDDLEFKFTTYNNTKLIKKEINNHFFTITLKKGNYYINLKSTYKGGLKLSAPVKGKMERNILESISSCITVTLSKKNHIIFSDTSTNCGLEIV